MTDRSNQADVSAWACEPSEIIQIMKLLHLARDIQEKLLFLPLIERGRDSILERHLRPIAAVPDWREQRRMWKELRAASSMTNRSSAVLLIQ